MLIYTVSMRHAWCTNKTVTNQSRVPFPFQKGEILSVWPGWENFLIRNNLGSKVIREDPILLLLSLPHIPSIFSLRQFQFRLFFILPRSPLPLNATLLAMLYFQHFLTSPPPTHFPPRLLSFIPAFISPEPISTFFSTFHAPSPLIHFRVPLSFATSTLPVSLHHTTTSIPPFHSCQLSEPQQS